MKRVLASLLTVAAVVPAFWFTINPDGERFCPTSGGSLVPYTVDRMNDEGETVTLSFDGAAQRLWCDNIAANPR